MKFVPNAVTKTFARQILLTKKNSPAIMLGGGITLAVTSTVLACKATLKVEEVLARHEDKKRDMREVHSRTPEEYPVKDYDHDQRTVKVLLARDLTKLYGPAVLTGLVGYGLITGAHITLTKRNAALAAAYAVLDRGFKEYRRRVVDQFGEEKDRELLYGKREKEIVEEGEHGHEVKTIKRFGQKSMYARLFDEYNRHWSPSPDTVRLWLQTQQNWANDALQARGHLFLNEVYDLLGMERSKAGAVVGWVVGNGDSYVDFGIFQNGNATMLNDYMLGEDGAVLLDFNVDGVVLNLIEKNQRAI